MAGVKPDFQSVELERIAENGTLDGEPIPCIFQDIPVFIIQTYLLEQLT
jgi:hypothetical protein